MKKNPIIVCFETLFMKGIVAHKYHTTEVFYLFAPDIPASVSTAQLGCTFEAPSFRSRRQVVNSFFLKNLMIK